MASTICSSSSCFAWKTSRQKCLLTNCQKSLCVHSSLGSAETSIDDSAEKLDSGLLKRRSLILQSGVVPLLSSLAAFEFPAPGLAVVKQGLLAGRVPGLSEPDEEGWRTYRRPDDKSGGHGVGWSPIIPYVFKVPEGWDEVPVSIADLGGTEIDLRFGNPKQGRLFVIVAPVRRFSDVLGDNVTIEEIGPPEKVIDAFGPEVIGENVEGKVLSMDAVEHSGRKYYQYELEPPHVFITATAAGNRLYLFNVTGSGLQWKRYYKDLKRIAESFRVV
uniref:PsbP C-terminal domain-containing protein n=1 Tax=Opuntia streptacantha TaxID=393608 RepID=A0A7C9D569_OPUST